MVKRQLINSWILSLRIFLIKRQIIEYYSKKCKLRPPSPHPTPQTQKKTQKKPSNNKITNKNKKKIPKTKKNHSQAFLRIQKFKKSWLFHIWNYIKIYRGSLAFPIATTPPPLPRNKCRQQTTTAWLLAAMAHYNSMSGIWNIKNIGLWFNTRKKLVKTSGDLMWVCNIFFHSYYVTGEIVLMI